MKNAIIFFFYLILINLSSVLSTEALRLYITHQYDWANKKGFHLYLQSTSEDGSPCKLENLYLIFGFGDGINWQVLSAHPRWELGKDYLVEASIGNRKGELRLNSAIIGVRESDFLPADEPLTVNYMPTWAKGPSDFIIYLKEIKISTSKGFEKEFHFPELPIPLFIFEPQNPKTIDWYPEQNFALKITAKFRLFPYPKLEEISPLIDRYGQCKYADWDGKIKSDVELKKSLEEEKRILSSLKEPEGYDRFGGFKLANWREKPTGFFRVLQKNGFWWLISPEGNPCFYLGLCGVPAINWDMTPVTGREFIFEWLPPKDSPFSSAWSKGIRGDPQNEYFSFHTANMIRKYGDGWRETALKLTRYRLKIWGFTGAGKWGEMENLPYLPVLYRWDVPNLVRHPDIFDPEIRTKFRESLKRQIEPKRNDPFVVGWSLGNEYSEIINKEEIKEILTRPENTPLKKALIEFILKSSYEGDWRLLASRWQINIEKKEALYKSKPNPPEEDIERMRRFYAEKYYQFIYETIKEIDPNHLYFGFWITPGWWENEEDWKICAKYCDVIGYDLYSYEFMDKRLRKLVEKTNKPILCGEFSFPPFYEGKRGFGIWEGGIPGGVKADDDAQAGELYKKWIKEASQNPFCVGVSWFIYRDQHITGIGGEMQGSLLVIGEHYAFGLVDIGDRPKWELVKRVRDANLSAVKLRLEANAQKKPYK
ncbi:hypothetical protein H5T87_02860 [bacterium]|nr:hypothetical protein [bacterium]